MIYYLSLYLLILITITTVNFAQIILLWKLQSTQITKQNLTVDKLFKKNTITETFFKLVLKLSVFSCIIIISTFKLTQEESCNIFFENFRLNNFTINVVEIIFLLNLVIFALLLNLKKLNLINKFNFVFSLVLITTLCPLIFFLNNLYAFFFFIELINILFFYKFITSRSWNKTNSESNNLFFYKSKNNFSQQYTHTLFFQYWNSFFSSILLFLSILYFTYYYTTTNKTYISLIESNSVWAENINNFFWNIFLIAIALKFGMTPLHLYKIEVYKGLNILSVFFYTIYLFFFFSQYLVILYTYFFTKLILKSFFLFNVILYLGVFYLVFILFSNKNIKTLFALSTLLNVLIVVWSLCLLV